MSSPSSEHVILCNGRNSQYFESSPILLTSLLIPKCSLLEDTYILHNLMHVLCFVCLFLKHTGHYTEPLDMIFLLEPVHVPQSFAECILRLKMYYNDMHHDLGYMLILHLVNLFVA